MFGITRFNLAFFLLSVVTIASIVLNAILLVQPDKINLAAEVTSVVSESSIDFESIDQIANDHKLDALVKISSLAESNFQIQTSLNKLVESIDLVTSEIIALKSQSATTSGNVTTILSESEISRRAVKNQRMREKLMLDVPEDQRATAMHQQWLEKNQDELATADLDIQRLDQIRQEFLVTKLNRTTQ